MSGMTLSIQLPVMKKTLLRSDTGQLHKTWEILLFIKHFSIFIFIFCLLRRHDEYFFYQGITNYFAGVV